MPSPRTPPRQWRWWPANYYPGSSPPPGFETGMYHRSQRGWKRNPGDVPFDLVLPYEGLVGWGTPVRSPQVPIYGYPRGVNSTPLQTVFHNGGGVTQVPTWARPTYNKAYARFKEKALGESAQLGVAAVEYKESFNLVARRALQLRSAYKDLRQGDLKGFANTLGVKLYKGHRSPSYARQCREKAKVASATWLEYWFGWAPMVGDMHAAAEVFTKRLPAYDRVHGSASLKGYIDDQIISNLYDKERIREECFVRYKTGATLVLTNPNLFLMNQLGLINPAAIAWESIPFSFVVDWVSGLGNVIDSWSDWVGVSVINPYTTIFYKSHWTQTYGSVSQFNSGLGSVVSARAIRSYRRVGLIQPLVTRPYFLNVASSNTRAASAVSLLVQQLLR